MKTRGMKITAIVAATALTALLALPYVVDVDRFRPQLESNLASSLGREVHVGHMQLSLLAGGARAEKISVADDPSFREGEFLQAKSLEVGIRWLPLILSRSIHVTSLTVEEPHLTLMQTPQGKWNVSTLGNANGDAQGGASSTGLDDSLSTSVVLDRLKIAKATIDVIPAGHEGQPTTFKNVEADLRNVSLDSAMTFVVTSATKSGRLEVKGEAGPMNRADSNQLPFHANVVAGTGSGTLAGSYEAKGENPMVHLKVTGNHLPLDQVAGILPAFGISLPGSSKLHGGTISANLSVDGSLNRLVTTGSAQIANAHLSGFDLGSKLSALPGMSEQQGVSELSIVSLSTHLHVSPSATHISGFNGQFAGIGAITGDGEVTADDRLQFKMVAHIASDGALSFGLKHAGLKNVPSQIPFQVAGTTSMPIIIPDLSGMSKNTTKQVAASAGRKIVEKAAHGAVKNTKTPSEPPVVATNKKAGFFHNLFHHRESEKKRNSSKGTQLASQKTKF